MSVQREQLEADVLIVGAGPAGLACAHKLATLGHAVTLFEAREKRIRPGRATHMWPVLGPFFAFC
jgi:2-polyprenyl-6-methoxyphenol hydroxylase-like FAD-dependent oxidoreductase